MYLLQYLLKVSISLVILYAFYRAVLRPLTFYQWNRFCLLGYSLLSFIIPFINVSIWMEESKNNNQLTDIIPAIGNYTIIMRDGAVTNTGLLQNLTVYQWLVIVFCLGAALMLLKFILRCISLRRIRSTSILLSSSNQVQLYQTSAPVSPFSFGNAIYFNASLHSEEELQRIILHEFVHVKQRHSFDLMVAELLCIVNWFNPFAWLIRYAIRQNLEFIADNDVITNGLDKKEYQYLLLKVVGIPQYSIASNFNFSNLKKRITMMNKMKSTRLQLTKFLFVLPLLVLLLLAFRNKTNTGTGKNNDVLQAAQVRLMADTLPAGAKISRDTIEIKDAAKEVIMSINRNDSTGSNANTATVTLNDGTKEFYNLNDPEQKAAFYKKYGKKVVPPPPPSAIGEVELVPPPAPVLGVELPEPGTPSAGPHLPGSVKGITTYQNTDKKSGIHIHTVTVTLENGKSEKYNLNDPKEKAAYKAKYGELPKAIQPLAPVKPIPPITEVIDVYNNDAHDSDTDRPHPKTDAPLYVVNGAVQPNLLDVNSISANDIERINVLKDKNAIDKYGDKARNGVIEIITWPPLYVIDSVVQPFDVDIKKLNPAAIKSMNVLKGKEATDKYGEKAAHGAVEIFIKKMDTPIPANVLLIIDDKEMPTGTKIEDVVKPADIESMEVYTGKPTIDKYGDKGKHNVINIKTRIHSQINKPESIKKDEPVMAHFGQLVVNGGMTTNNNESIINGSFFFENKTQMPLIILDGAEISGVTSFKADKARFRMVTVNASQAVAKYGNKAIYGALEITHLSKIKKTNL